MVKKLDDVIKNAFENAGFSEKEVMDGCWLLEKPASKGSSEMKPIAWIALHKFLERVAQRMNIWFSDPVVMNCTPEEIAVLVKGSYVDKDSVCRQTWSIGEASQKNCKNDYRWAMAEKRAKDRVILKLLGIAGDMYSEEEADEFKQTTPQEKAKATRAVNKEIKANDLDERFGQWTTYWKTHEWTQAANASFRKFLDDAKDYDQDKLNELVALFKTKAPEETNDSLPDWA